MKLLILLTALFLLSSCSLFKDDPQPGDPEFLSYTYFKTGRFTAPASFSAPLTELYNGYSKSLKINNGDRIRIRFYDATMQSQEQELIMGSSISTLQSVLSRLESFIAQSGTTVQFEMDTTREGYINVKKISGPSVYNINIENMTHPISKVLMLDVFWWQGEITGNLNHSSGACRSYATASSRLVYLADSAGGKVGLEVGDTIFVKGAFSGIPIVSQGRHLAVSDKAVTLGSVLAFMASSASSVRPSGVDFQLVSFSRPYLSGSILMRIQDYDSTMDSLMLFSNNANSNTVLPSNFNANIQFEDISSDDVWVIDTGGIVIDTTRE